MFLHLWNFSRNKHIGLVSTLSFAVVFYTIEHNAENIKHEYLCPICKEVLDQPVQTKCPTPHIFCGSCLSFSFEMCGTQCPVCRTLVENPGESIEPAPFVLQTIISELEFQCCTYSQAIKLHQLPQHQQEGCVPGPPPSNPNTASTKEVTLHSDSVVHVHNPTTQPQTVMPTALRVNLST